MAKYPDWMPKKKPYTTAPEPIVEEIPAEEPVPQRTVRCNDCNVEMLFHSSSEVQLVSPGMFRTLQEFLSLAIYECPQCGQYKFYKAPVEDNTPTPASSSSCILRTTQRNSSSALWIVMVTPMPWR